MIQAQIVPDIRRLKESHLRRMEAECAKEEAEAQKRLAEAAEAANRATIVKRNDALAKAAKRKATAEADKVEAEADAVRMDAVSRRLQAIGEAMQRLADAANKLRQDGGEVFFSEENLRRIATIKCEGCGKRGPLALEQNEPAPDELTVDLWGFFNKGMLICGACLAHAEEKADRGEDEA